MKILKTIKICALSMSALILAGCAHPDLIDVGTPENAVLTELGMPDSKMTQPDGSFILVYSMQPSDRKSIGCALIKMGIT